MASSASKQYNPNPALWLATRVGKMVLSFPMRIMHCLLQEKVCEAEEAYPM